MTIEWHYTMYPDLGVLSLAGHLGPEAVARFTGAIGWVLPRGTGPVTLDLTELRGWSVGGQTAVAQAARQLAQAGRGLEPPAIPADGSLVPDGTHPPIPVHYDLPAALTAHRAMVGEQRGAATSGPKRRTASTQRLMQELHRNEQGKERP